ncbi:hypothetical protein FACS1894132_10160 [Clostridia bacterium]|nr:hypothetical protein FACS1894132_10160 [Clostridia bacterium]
MNDEKLELTENKQDLAVSEQNELPSYFGLQLKKDKKEYSKKEKILLLLALFLGVLLDRLTYFSSHMNIDAEIATSIFWLSYIVIIYAVFWQKLKNNKILWFVTIASILLCFWNFFYPTTNNINENYMLITFFVIPAVLMAHTVFATGNFNLKQIPSLLGEYFLGWFAKPFTAWGVFFGSLGSLVKTKNQHKNAGKIILGLVICLPILAIIIPLLMASDSVFDYYLKNIDLNLEKFILHGFIIFIVTVLFYSFIWNMGFSREQPTASSNKVSFDIVISYTVLIVIEVIYLLFCLVQFKYLFAGAGLPNDLTYAQYAHKGFGEMVLVSLINLTIVGVFLECLQNKHTKKILLILVAETLIIIASSSTRLALYVDTYDLTWLRLLSL